MTQEDKRLLLIDLSGRLPYNVKVRVTYWDNGQSLHPKGWSLSKGD